MVEKLIQHKHCGMCGKAIPADLELCGEECENAKGAMIKKRKTYVYLMYGAIIVMMIFLFVGLVFGR